MAKTDNLSQSYQSIKTVKIVKNHFSNLKEFKNLQPQEISTPVNYFQRNINMIQEDIKEKVVSISPIYPKFIQKNPTEKISGNFGSELTSDMDSYRIYTPKYHKNSTEDDSVTFEDNLNPFDTIDSAKPMLPDIKKMSSEIKNIEEELNYNQGYQTLDELCMKKTKKIGRKSILKKGKSENKQEKKKVKFANISLIKKLRPEEIIQSPLSEVEGLYMPTVFYFQIAKPIKSNTISFRPAKISLNNNRIIKKSRKKYHTSRIMSTVDYTNQKDYSTRNGGYCNLIKIRDSSLKAQSISQKSRQSRKSVARGFSTEKNYI